jgi:hypothetical protein
MKYYIIHNDALIERRNALQVQLDKFGISEGDVEWVTSFPVSHQFVSQIKEETGTILPLGHVSCSLKHYDALNRMVSYGIREAIIFEDDVIISDFYDEAQIPKHPYVKLGRGPLDCIVPLGSPLCKIPNPGGSEAYYVTIDFAAEYLKNVSFAINVDLEQYFFMRRIKMEPLCLSMCHQDFISSFDRDQIDYKSRSIEYYHGKLPTFDISKILNTI